MVKPNFGKTAADLRFLYLSPASRYALLGMRALTLGSGKGGFKLVAESARRGGLPANTLAKIFQRLAKSGLLFSQRGPGGGYALAKPPPQITLADILRAVQDIVPGGHHCLLGNGLCGDGGFCLIHNVIAKADELVIKSLEALTLDDLAKSDGFNLKPVLGAISR